MSLDDNLGNGSLPQLDGKRPFTVRNSINGVSHTRVRRSFIRRALDSLTMIDMIYWWWWKKVAQQ